MTTTQSTETSPTAAAKSSRIKPTKYFYLGAAILLLILMLLGFQQFYLHGRAFPGRPLAPPIRGLIIVHGVSMTMWIVLLMIQSALIVNRKRKLHMLLGQFGVILAVVIVISGLKLGIESARIAPPEVMLWGLNMKQFMTVPIITILLFAGFVAFGVIKRKKPAIHRPMMLLASLTAGAAAVDRTPMITALYNNNFIGQLFGPFSAVLLFGLILLAAQYALSRKFDRVFAIGLLVSIACGTFFFTIAPTPLWDGIATFLLSL